MRQDDSPIEVYLDHLVTELAGHPPRELRSLLAEVEAHLRDVAEAAMADGLPLAQAEAQAVARFGPVRAIAAAERRRVQTGVGALVRQSVITAWLLGSIGALAVGVSGLIAAVIRLVAGERALVDVAPGRVLSAADCTRWLAISPAAGNCRDAALADWAAETVFYRLALGLLGAVTLLGYVWFRRRFHPRLLPALITDTIAVTLFVAAAAGTLLFGIDTAMVSSWHGSGQWFSAVPVAVAAAAVFTRRLIRDLRAAPLAAA